MRYTDMAAVRKANTAAGHFWFTPGAVSFFNTRFESDLIEGRYFITSESPADGNDSDYERGYAVRFVMDNGHIATMGEIRDYATLEEARAAAMDHYHSHNVNGEVPDSLFR